MTFDISKLMAPFDPAAVHFRAQSLTRDGKKAMALAYLDARDVMDRLDNVCGPANWQTEYFETAKGRLICRLSINIDGAWITKSDGAGDTDVEGEKGAISDALKRAAVSWGIGRYLYRLGAIWVPCESYEKNGKHYWKRWTVDPWKVARMPEAQAEPDEPSAISEDQFIALRDLVDGADANLAAMLKHYGASSLEQFPLNRYAEAVAALNKKIEQARAADLGGDIIPHQGE